MSRRTLTCIVSISALLALVPAVPAVAQENQSWTVVTSDKCSTRKANWVMQHAGPGEWVGSFKWTVTAENCPRLAEVGSTYAGTVTFRTGQKHGWVADLVGQTGARCHASGMVTSGTTANGSMRCDSQEAGDTVLTLTSPTPFYRMAGG
ncbi:MAG: hypothetical protein KGN34_01240 [Sphingomonadales bacterium]|nr:hypothetical protein [Sphingomonadales bacterium]